MTISHKRLFFNIKGFAESLLSLFEKKNTAYADSENGIKNFTDAAQRENKKPHEILHGYYIKHDTSYRDIMNKISKGEEVSEDLIDEKIGDMIVYLLIQREILKLQNDDNKKNDSK